VLILRWKTSREMAQDINITFFRLLDIALNTYIIPYSGIKLT